MDTFSAFAMGEANRGNEMKVFDWVKAGQLIKERSPEIVEAGLREDWSWTAGEIYRNGDVVKEEYTYVYLRSTWATPVLKLDFDEVECWRMESEITEYGPEAYWPECALQILED